MDRSPAYVAAKLLIQLGLCSEPGSGGRWPAYAGREPPSPDDCVTVFDTTGTKGFTRSQTDGEPWGMNGVQFRVRSADGQAGWAKAAAIQDVLSRDVYHTTVAVGDSRYLVDSFNKFNDVLPVGAEPTSQRAVHTMNCMVYVEQVA